MFKVVFLHCKTHFNLHLFSAHWSNVISEISVQKVNELSHHQMIKTGEDGFLLKPLGMIEPLRWVFELLWYNFWFLSFLVLLEPGRLMTKYYLKFDTMKHIMQTPDNCRLEDALNVICRAEEIACTCTSK